MEEFPEAELTHLRALSHCMFWLLKSGNEADCSILCRNKTLIPLHVAFVSIRSPVLAFEFETAAIRGHEYPVYGIKTVPGQIYVGGHDDKTVERMVQYLYTGRYTVQRPATADKTESETSTETGEEDPISCVTAKPGEAPEKKYNCERFSCCEGRWGPPEDNTHDENCNCVCLIIHRDMYAIGSSYGIKGLKAFAATCLQYDIETSWNTPIFTELLADLHKKEEVGGDDVTLKRIMERGAFEHIQGLLNRSDFVAFFKSNSVFALKVAREMANATWVGSERGGSELEDSRSVLSIETASKIPW